MKKDEKINAPVTTKEKIHTYYDSYNYKDFWKSREYDHQADVVVLRKFLNKIKNGGQRVIEVGAGFGRLVPHYFSRYKEVILIDPSMVQLKNAQRDFEKTYPNLSFVRGIAQKMPFEDNYADTIICVRVSHYISDFSKPIKEFMRVLVPGGYLILEVANKLHMKARFLALLKGKSNWLASPNPISRKSGNEDDIPFVNHNPTTIENELLINRFEIISVQSVSNFRSPLLKKIFPVKIIIFFELLMQRPLARFWFGPSIYFLARKPNKIL